MQDTHPAKNLAATGKKDEPVCDAASAMHRAVRLEFPQEFPARRRQAIEMLVVRPNEHTVSDDDGRRFDLASGLERPEPATVAHAHGMKHTREVADVNHTATDARRRFAYALPRRPDDRRAVQRRD